MSNKMSNKMSKYQIAFNKLSKKTKEDIRIA